MNDTPRYAELGGQRIIHGLLVAIAVKASVFVGPLLGRALASSDEEVMAGGAVSWITFTVMFAVQLAILYGALFRYGRVSPRAIGWSFQKPALELVLGVAGFLACFGIMAAVMAAFGALDVDEFGAYLASRSVSQQLLFCGIGTIAAFSEESIYRGYVQPAAMSRFGAVAGWIGVALIFDLMHLQIRPIQLLSKLGIGLVLGGLRGKDRSLYAPGVAHFLIWAVAGMY